MLILAVLSLGLMFADNHWDYMSEVRYYASFVVTPVYWLADLPLTVAGRVESTLQSRSALREENARLREQLRSVQYELQKLTHLSAENRRLNKLLNASTVVDERVVRTRLISESPDPFSKKVLINKGGTDGVFMGQPVLDAYGLMGQVVEVLPHSSWVLLITDPLHSTPVLVNRNGVRAVATGAQGSIHRMVLSNIPNTTDIQEGDVLVTSGLGQRFPAGYPVGVISRVVHDPGRPFAEVRVAPAARLDRSRNLLLVFAEGEGAQADAGSP